MRLQEEIIRIFNDLSFFAWQAAPNDDQAIRGILSNHPREFSNLKTCTREIFQHNPVGEFAMTNGLRICVSSDSDKITQTFVLLEHHLSDDVHPSQFWVVLRKAGVSTVRAEPCHVQSESDGAPFPRICHISRQSHLPI